MHQEKNIFNNTLEHLPHNKRQEIEVITQVIQNHVKPRILEKIILFGSYATGKWVEDTYVEEGTTYRYASDYDILIATKGKETLNEWTPPHIRRLLRREEGISHVSVIQHTMNFLNEHIKNQYYFFLEIFRQGILLYDAGRQPLEVPRGVTPSIRLEKAQEEFAYWLEKGDDSLAIFKFCLLAHKYNEAAFNLHQATERYYAALMLVFTDYKAKTHDLEELDSAASKFDSALKGVFPCRNEEEERLFELLRRAYVEARYKKDYSILPHELDYLAERVTLLRTLTARLCEEEIERLEQEP